MNFSALYLSIKRLNEVVTLAPGSRIAGSIGLVPGLARLRPVGAYEDAIVRWMEVESPHTLGELLSKEIVTEGAFFTHLGPFYGRGVSKGGRRYTEGRSLKTVPTIWTNLDSWSEGRTIHLQAHPENYTTMSATGELSGRKRLFVLGRITDASGSCLTAQAYAIGHIYQYDHGNTLLAPEIDRLPWQMEVFPGMIDSFALTDNEAAPTSAELEMLLTTPESDIKTAFAEIIGECFVQKDWGGERSDLVSTQLRWQGQQYSAAFLFKGPAKPKPMTVADLGKNGDQISRLYSEPADFLVLQHCHSVTSAVRDHMRAFATRIGQLRYFAIVDGADTVRILRRHSKLGFGVN